MRDLLSGIDNSGGADIYGRRDLLANMGNIPPVVPEEESTLSRFSNRAMKIISPFASALYEGSKANAKGEAEGGRIGLNMATAIPMGILGGYAAAPGLLAYGAQSLENEINQRINPVAIPVPADGYLTGAGKVLEKVGGALQIQPRSRAAAKGEEDIGTAVMEPFKMVGRGLGAISEGITTGSLQKASDVAEGKSEGSNILTPISKIIGEADAIFAAGGLGRTVKARVNAVKNSSYYRGLTIKERGLVTQSLDDIMRNNPTMSEAEAVRVFPNLFEESLQRRMVKTEGMTPEPAPQPRDLLSDKLALPEEGKKLNKIIPKRNIETDVPIKLGEPVDLKSDNVFARMPEEQLAPLAEQKVQGAVDEFARRSGTIPEINPLASAKAKLEGQPNAKGAEIVQPMATSGGKLTQPVSSDIIPPVEEKPGTVNIPAKETPVAEADVLYHGGTDLGTDLTLRTGNGPGGGDSGAIFLTPSVKYAKQYAQDAGQNNIYSYKLQGEKIFDITNPKDTAKFKDGFLKNWEEDYSSKADALKDYKAALQSLQETSAHGAVDWATASSYMDQLEKAGFDGAKFLERPGENITVLPDGGFDVSGPPVYSYALFKKELKVSKTELPNPTRPPEVGEQKLSAEEVKGKQTEIPIIDEETYLTQHGASRQDIGESALHKNIPEGNIRKRLVENQAAKDRALVEKRDQLRKEYNQKIEAGEIRPPTRIEKLIGTANGHPDNASVQAARRILEGKGIDWKQSYIPEVKAKEDILTNPTTEISKPLSEQATPKNTKLFDASSVLNPVEIVEVIRGLKGNIQEAIPHLETLGRNVYEGGKTRFLDWNAQMKVHLGDLWDSFKSVLKDVWDRIKKTIGNEKGTVGKDISGDIKNIFSDIGEVTDQYLGSISTRLGNIHPSIKNTLRKFEYTRGIKATARTNKVLPFLEKVAKIPKADKEGFDLARKNGDPVELRKYVEKYKLGKEHHELKNVLSEMYNESIAVGYDVGYRPNYHPRVLKDSKGFLNFFYKHEKWPIINKAIKAKEIELNRLLDTDEKAKLINSMLRGYPSSNISLSKPGQLKERLVETITPAVNEFYMDSDAALVHYINNVTDAIEAKKLFGGGVKTSKGFKSAVPLEDTIGGYVLRLLAEEKIMPDQEQVLTEILRARFNEVGTHGFVSAYKNLSYIDTMGSVISAVTQIGDLAWALYKNGLGKTISATGNAIINRSSFRKEDLGVERIATEFADESKTSRAVEKVFKWTGLTKIDNIGKESLINSTYKVARQKSLTEKGKEKLIKELEPIFEGETNQLITDLQKGNVTDNVKLYLFNTLSDFQPISLSEMPEKYLTGGNGRVFYMLKTFTLKQFDAFRREVFQKIGTEGQRVQGMKNLIHLAVCFVVANATADEIKDFILNRKTSFSDRVIDNMFRLLGVGKFVVWQARREGLRSAVVKQIAPPAKAADAVLQDATTAGDDKGLEITQSIPIFGKLYYWWFGKGADKTEKQDRKGQQLGKLKELKTIKGL